MIDFKNLEAYIINRLTNELSDKLLYHNLNHTLYVTSSAETIAKKEKLDKKSIELIKTAALFHDLGYIKQYNNNEPIATLEAIEALPKFGYEQGDILLVCKMIMATSIKVTPNNLLEYIICDADHYYFGDQDVSIIANNLRKEMENYNIYYSDIDWLKLQIKYLEKHKYYTETAIKSREHQKQAYIKFLKTQLNEQ
ncbi:MAG: hypothetical protein Kow0079_06700 [Vicingaceae bacterium]